MNETQQLFAVFFAIMWGTAANAQPRWKAFQYPLLFLKEVKWRVCLSILILNILPLLYFGIVLWCLRGNSIDNKCWTISILIKIVCGSILPAFAPFGFYRFWISCVERKPSKFYREDETEALPSSIEPTIKSLGLNSIYSNSNLIAATIYLAIGILGVIIYNLITNNITMCCLTSRSKRFAIARRKFCIGIKK